MRLSAPAPDQEVDLSRINLLEPGYYAVGDPHAAWLYLRRSEPVYRQSLDGGGGFWVVTRYEDVCRVLRSHTEFTSEQGTMLCILNMPDIARGQMMAVTDPPRHTRMREPLARALTMKAVQAQKPRIHQIVADLLTPGLSGEPWDFAEAALLFPMEFTGVMMGLPSKDWERLTRLTTLSIAHEDAEFAEGRPRATLRQAHHELFAYFSSEIARRRGSPPADDLIGVLMTMTVEGVGLSDAEIILNCYSLLLGANVTTPHVASAIMMAMAENPDEYRRWAAHPQLLASGIEEGLRWSSPANHFMRYAAQDVELRGVVIPSGAPVTAWLGSANRDEAVFDDPFRFDVGRHPNRHVAFGFGPHYCIGAPLARFALRTLFSEVLRCVERIEIAGPIEHLTSNFVAGIKRMPIRLTPRPGVFPVVQANAGPLLSGAQP